MCSPRTFFRHPSTLSSTCFATVAPVAFSLPHALYSAGLLKSERLCHFVGLRQDTRKQWKNPAQYGQLWQAIAKLGISRESIDEEAGKLQGILLGHALQPKRDTLFNSGMKFSRDIAHTLMVLSRVRGQVFSPANEPDYSWDALLSSIFCVHATRFEGVPLTDPVWPQELIEAERKVREENKPRCLFRESRRVCHW